MNELIISYIIYYSTLYGVDPLLARAVVYVESRGNATAIGQAGEVGLFQLLPSSFPKAGKKLYNTKHNIAIGIKYLADMKKYCPHQLAYSFVSCYNLGVAGASKIKYPLKLKYYKNIMNEYRRLQRES